MGKEFYPVSLSGGLPDGVKVVVNKFYKCNPPKSTWQSTKKILKVGNRIIIGGGKERKRLEAFFADLLADISGLKLQGALVVRFAWCYPMPASVPKWVKGAIRARRISMQDNSIMLACTTKPDYDNHEKTIGDMMTRLGVIEDDSIICDGRLTKCYSDDEGRVGIWVLIGQYAVLEKAESF